MEFADLDNNECPWCGKNRFYEYIKFNPQTLVGSYEFNCPDCGKKGEHQIKVV
jgi:endogenous inhibitor of DNA gyrase (YacG/DUF329 family)